MKNKTLTKVVVSAIVLSTLATVSAFAANTKEIKAYLNYDLKIKYDMQEQNLFDAEGNRVYPISYNGTTYLPVRAIGNLFDVNVDWDGDTYSVLLGKTGEIVDFIEDFAPSYKYSDGGSVYYAHYQTDSSGYHVATIGNEKYQGYIYMKIMGFSNDKIFASYDLDGKYKTLQFDIISKAKKDDSISILGDDDKVIKKIDLKNGDVLKTVTVDVTGMSQIKFMSNSDTYGYVHEVYIVNATIQ